MTDDTIPSHADALALLRRLRGDNDRLRAELVSMGAENERLRSSLNSVLDQKAELLGAIARGTLAAPTPDDDQPATYTHDVPPNAPR